MAGSGFGGSASMAASVSDYVTSELRDQARGSWPDGLWNLVAVSFSWSGKTWSNNFAPVGRRQIDPFRDVHSRLPPGKLQFVFRLQVHPVLRRRSKIAR